MNAVEIEEAITLLADQPFDPESFPFAFLEAFGNKATTIKRLKSGSSNSSDVEGGVLQRNNIHMVVCGEGEVTNALATLKASPATNKSKAKFILATDGIYLEAKGLEFKAVVVMACDDDILPLQERIETVADETELDEVYETERHLFYVACTRARDRLLVSGVSPASEFFADIEEG